MNTTSRNKTLIFIIILLFITNILVLTYFLTKNKDHRKDKGKDAFETSLQKDVGFSEQQLATFKQQKDMHWTEARKQMDDIKKIKERFFKLTLQDSVADSTVNALADSIAMRQKQMELTIFHNFKQTRSICTPSQLPAYDSLMVRFINRQMKGGKPKS